MPRGRRESALVTLVNELDGLDSKRRKLVAKIQEAAGALEAGPATGAAAGRRGRSSAGVQVEQDSAGENLSRSKGPLG